MDNKQSKILVLVEGEKRDVNLMTHLFGIYGITGKHEIVPYRTTIYELYNSMFVGKNPADFDILLHLKARESDSVRKLIFDERYVEILLIFDLDPHDDRYSDKAIREMMDYFTESTDMGKLYINYPMVEAFYHMCSIPDNNYNTYIVPMSELHPKNFYKQRVNVENRNHDYSKFATDRRECSIVIKQNICKAWHIIGKTVELHVPDSSDILEAQLIKLSSDDAIAVLCTCIFYIADYNPKLLES